MPITLEDEAENCVSISPCSATFPGGAPTDGWLLTAGVYSRATSLTNPSGWDTAIDVTYSAVADVLRQAFRVADGDGATVSFTISPDDQAGIYIAAHSGMLADQANVLDATASTAYTTGVTSLTSGTTAALAQNDELGFVSWGLRASVTNVALTNGYAIQMDTDCGSPPARNVHGDKTITNGAAQESTASWTTSTDTGGLISTFKAAASGIYVAAGMVMGARPIGRVWEVQAL